MFFIIFNFIFIILTIYITETIFINIIYSITTTTNTRCVAAADGELTLSKARMDRNLANRCRSSTTNAQDCRLLSSPKDDNYAFISIKYYIVYNIGKIYSIIINMEKKFNRNFCFLMETFAILQKKYCSNNIMILYFKTIFIYCEGKTLNSLNDRSFSY